MFSLLLTALPTTIGVAQGVSAAKKEKESQDSDDLLRKFTLRCSIDDDELQRCPEAERWRGGGVVLRDGKVRQYANISRMREGASALPFLQHNTAPNPPRAQPALHPPLHLHLHPTPRPPLHRLPNLVPGPHAPDPGPPRPRLQHLPRPARAELDLRRRRDAGGEVREQDAEQGACCGQLGAGEGVVGACGGGGEGEVGGGWGGGRGGGGGGEVGGGGGEGGVGEGVFGGGGGGEGGGGGGGRQGADEV